MVKKWKENYNKRSIQLVIVTTLSIVSIVSFLILAIFFTHYEKDVLEDFIREENEQQIEVLAEGVEREFRQAVDFMDTVHYKVIKKEFSKRDNFNSVMDFLFDENKKFISNLVIFTEDGTCLYENHDERFLELTEQQMERMYENGRSDVAKTWFAQIPQCDDILMYRIVEMEQNEEISQVILAGTIKYDTIVSGFRTHNGRDGNYFYMKNLDGDIFYHPKALQISHGIYEEKLGMDQSRPDGCDVENVDGKRYLIHQCSIGYTGWKIVGVSCVSDILYKDYPVGYLIWTMFLVVCILAIGVNRFIVHKITGPISELSDMVAKIGQQDLDTKIEVKGTYEIKNLADNFNRMQDRIRQLMTKEVQKEQEHWSMKMRLLQSQINPHFLYNTLDSIIWMIQSKRYEGASKMVSALAGFFRISLNKGSDFITVEREMAHVGNYMDIQGIRFEDKFTFEMECEDSVKHYMCPKLIIQPLAENAVYHGMEGMYGDGEILITAYEKDDLIYIDVIDNGEGMTEEQIDKIMHGNVVSGKRGSGIGVRNVNERLKYCFGEKYGITVLSEIDEGTTVRICIPKVEDLDEYWKKENIYVGDGHNPYSSAFSSGMDAAEEKGDSPGSDSSKGR